MIKTALIYFIFDYCIDKLFEPIINAFEPPLCTTLMFGKKYTEISTSSLVGSLAMIQVMEGLKRIDCTYYNCTLVDNGSNDLLGLKSIGYEGCYMSLYFDSDDSARMFHLKSKTKTKIRETEYVELTGRIIHIKSSAGYSMVAMTSIVGFVE